MEDALWPRWERTCRRVGERPIVIEADTGRTLSARALHADALAFAQRLPAGRPGDRIAFRLPNGTEWLACFLALQARGFAAAPLDHGLPEAGAMALARQIGARALYLDGAFREFPGHSPGRRGVACLKITSGSSGAPKVIACRAAHLVADGEQIARTMGLRGRDRHLALIPLGHSYGLGNLVMPLLLQGATLVTAAAYTPRQVLEWSERHSLTIFPGVPALFRVLAALPGGPGKSPWRVAISAGAPLAPEVTQAFRRRFGRPLHNFYGSSETGGICYDRTGAASLTGRSVGKPLHGVTVTVRGGRVTVASPAVATPTGRWQVPDHGALTVRGELMLLGRAGKQANIGGKKFHPAEVEQALRSLPGVTDAAVWLDRRTGRDGLVAAVESRRTRPALERALGTLLPAWKMPRDWRVVRHLPRTARGKLDPAALRTLLA